MELSPRLCRIAENIPARARFADVGTDHAYLPVFLLLKGTIRSAIATDLRRGPLERAEENALRFGVADRISFRLCDGLSGIRPEEADTIAIAGMGGETIAAILKTAPWAGEGDHLFLLQPMSAIPDLRDFLQKNGFAVQREFLAVEGKKFYVILAVRPGQPPPLTLAERWAGCQWPGMEEPARGAYLDDLERRARRALAGLRSGSASPEQLRKLEELSAVAEGLHRMKKEWETWQR